MSLDEAQDARFQELLAEVEAAASVPEPPDPDVPVVGGELRARAIRSRLLDPNAVDGLEEPGWLIENYITAGGLATIFGRPGSFKTFAALDWACSVASGTWWNGHAVTQGPVLYVMAEGAGGLRRRKQAWEKANRVMLSEFPITWYPQPVNLLDPEWSEGLAIVAAERHVILTVIDTVARSMPGGDENTSRDMGTLISAADKIRNSTGGAVILVHHTPLDGGRLRGHSSLEGAVDTNIGVDSDGTTIKITVDKQKDSEPPEPLLLHPEPYGESIVLRPGAGRTEELPPAVLAVLAALHDLDLGEGITNSQWIGDIEGMSPRHAQRHVKRLLEAGYCQTLTGQPGQRGARYTITDQGRRVLDR